MDDYSRISLFEAILLQFSGKRLPGIQMNEESAKQLADDIEEKIPAEMISLLEWNEVLHLLCRCAPENTPESARQKLLSELRFHTNQNKSRI